jgi:hypothetical protein
MLRDKGLRRPGCVAVFVKDNVVCSFLDKGVNESSVLNAD